MGVRSTSVDSRREIIAAFVSQWPGSAATVGPDATEEGNRGITRRTGEEIKIGKEPDDRFQYVKPQDA